MAARRVDIPAWRPWHAVPSHNLVSRLRAGRRLTAAALQRRSAASRRRHHVCNVPLVAGAAVLGCGRCQALLMHGD
jgi:hypothetical protein